MVHKRASPTVVTAATEPADGPQEELVTITAPTPGAAEATLLTRRLLRGVPQWWRASSRDAFVVSLVLVTGLWAFPHGVIDLTGGPAAALTSVGRLAGLIASDLLLVQVLLMRGCRCWSGRGARTNWPGCTASSVLARSP